MPCKEKADCLQNMSRCHSGVWNLYPTSSTFIGVLYGFMAVAVYIYAVCYNDTRFALFFTSFQLSSM